VEPLVSTARFPVLVLLVLGAVLAAVHLLLREPDSSADHPGGEDAAELETAASTAPSAAVNLQGSPAAGAAAPARGVGPAPPTEAALAPGEVLVRGRLVAPDGAAARDGAVEIVHGDEVLARRSASTEGLFAVLVRVGRIRGSTEIGLRAMDAAGHRAEQQVWLASPAPRGSASPEAGRAVDVGVVRLLTVHSLEIEVRLPAGGTPPALAQAGARGMTPFLPFASAHRTDAEGRLRLDLPEGTTRLLAVAEGCGRQFAWVSVPRERPGPVVIELPPERLVTVEVVDGVSGAPVAGAEITASETVQAPGASYVTTAAWWPPLAPPHTDASGRLVVRGLGPDQRLTLVANAAGYPRAVGTPPRFQAARLGPDATSVRIEMAPPRTVRWPLGVGPVPPPPEGAAMEIRPAPGTYLADEQIPTSGRIESAALVVAGWPPGFLHGLAVAPDGSMARLFAKEGEDVGAPITFFPVRRIEVLLRYADGTPATGWFVNVRNQGNNPLAPPTPTGPDGRASIEGLYGGPHGLVEVHVSDRNGTWGGTPAGTVDLEKGDGSLEAVVERARDAVLCFSVAGELRLPPDPRISLGATYAASLERDEEAAEIRFPWRPQPGQAEAPLSIEADGYLPISRRVTVPPPGTPLVVDVVLEPAGAFVVRVALPGDGQARLAVQRWKAETSTWESLWLPMTRMGGYAQPDANGVIRFTPLATGRYRALDTMAGVASATVDVVPGGAVPEVAIDLGRSGWAKGRVIVPDGREPAGVTVHVEGVEDVAVWADVATRGVTTSTQRDGTFTVRVPGDREVVLRPEAPTLRPHPTEGTARVSAPRGDLLLRLVQDDTASVTLDRPLGPGTGSVPAPGQGPTRAVCLYAGKAEGEPLLRTTARLEREGRGLVFGGFRPGTYTVWIDADPFAPVVLPDRVLGPGTTDLGEAAVAEGVRVSLHILLPEGRAAPRAFVWARRQMEPEYARRMDFQGTSAVLGGLGPGRWKIQVGTHMGVGLDHIETVDLNEGEEQRITIDAR
jgi:hypothetical protein